MELLKKSAFVECSLHCSYSIQDKQAASLVLKGICEENDASSYLFDQKGLAWIEPNGSLVIVIYSGIPFFRTTKGIENCFKNLVFRLWGGKLLWVGGLRNQGFDHK